MHITVLVVSIVPADGLSPLGTRPSACTLIKFVPSMYTVPALE